MARSRTQTRYLDLRYQLLPYIYSEAAAVTFQGSTLMRPLVMDFAPTIGRSSKNTSTCSVPLFWSPRCSKPEQYNGMSTHPPPGRLVRLLDREPVPSEIAHIDAPLEEMPLLVRAGSIVPIGPVEQYTGEKPATTWRSGSIQARTETSVSMKMKEPTTTTKTGAKHDPLPLERHPRKSSR